MITIVIFSPYSPLIENINKASETISDALVLASVIIITTGFGVREGFLAQAL